MPRTARPDGLAELLDQQFAMVSRGQLLALGMTDHHMQYRVRPGGPWRGLLPGVYLGVTGETNLLQKEMAALTGARNVRMVVADAVQRGRCTVSQLAGEVDGGPIRGSATFRSVLSEVADGIRSTAEGDLRDLIRVARLPMPLFNASLYDGDAFIAKPDGWWPDAGVAAEVDSREWHLSPADWERTMARHDLMAAVGIILLHFPPSQIRREPAKVAQLIQSALERGHMRPNLPVRTVPCVNQLTARL